MKLTVEISCCFCIESHKIEIDLPEGWDTRYGETDVEGAFCPKHAKVAEFAESQCPGCVGGWGDCSMWKAFAYASARDITAEDLATMRTGKCPRRTNGSFGFDTSTGITEDINLSEQATDEAGGAFADAIEEYCRAYPARS